MKAKTCHYFNLIVILVFLSIFAGVKSLAQVQDKTDTQQEFRERLRDSEGIFVSVEVIGQEESDVKSLTEELEKEVENQLKQSKIKILTKEESDNIPERPRLGIYLITYKEPSQKNVFLYSFRVVHYEVASLVRSKRYVEGICWDSGLYIGMERKTAIRNNVREQVAKYIQDYITANSKFLINVPMSNGR